MSTQKLEFKTDVKKVLDIIIRSLYQHKEVFLRELISNASDALNKVRIKTLTSEKVFQKDLELVIDLIPNKDEKTLTIKDTGVGMNKGELIENLGTIAHSGTLEFLEKIEDSPDKNELIGQFGVGFYSAFLVSDKVEIKTRSFSPNAKAYHWTSDGETGYDIEETQKDERGTEIILHLKEDDLEYFESHRLKSLVKKYSDFVTFPIRLIEIKKEEETEEKETDEEKVEGSEEKEDKGPEILNSQQALWRQDPSTITQEQYLEFYRNTTNKYDEPFVTIHIKTESPIEFYSVLFIPSTKSASFYMPDVEWGLRLYSKKILIQEHNKDLLPEYLRFIVGVVDSEDLPLNVSREVVQNNRVIQTMKKYIQKKVIEELEKLASDDHEKYLKFYREYGVFLKEGVTQNDKNKDKLIRLLRFYSTYDHVDGRTGSVSLDDYITRMKPNQEEIYYLVGNDIELLKRSPHLEYYEKEGFEVLLLAEPIDNFLMINVREYEEKKFFLIDQDETESKTDTGSEDEKEDKEDNEEEETGPHADLIKTFKEKLGDKVKDVKISQRLVSSPVRLVTPKGGLGSDFQRAMKYMSANNVGGGFGSDVLEGRILQINPEHPIIKGLEKKLNEDITSTIIDQLYENAVMSEGEVTDLNKVVKNMETIIEKLLA